MHHSVSALKLSSLRAHCFSLTHPHRVGYYLLENKDAGWLAGWLAMTQSNRGNQGTVAYDSGLRHETDCRSTAGGIYVIQQT